MTRTVNLYPTPGGIAPSDCYAVTINGMASFTYLTTSPAETDSRPATRRHGPRSTCKAHARSASGGWDGRFAFLRRAVTGYIVRKACEIAGN